MRAVSVSVREKIIILGLSSVQYMYHTVPWIVTVLFPNESLLCMLAPFAPSWLRDLASAKYVVTDPCRHVVGPKETDLSIGTD